jgi:hypothetical protein
LWKSGSIIDAPPAIITQARVDIIDSSVGPSTFISTRSTSAGTTFNLAPLARLPVRLQKENATLFYKQ